MEFVSRIYNGPFPAVEIPLGAPLPDGTHTLNAVHGEITPGVPLEVAERLDEQGDWLLPDGSLPEAAKPREARVFTKDELRAVAEEKGIDVPNRSTKTDIENLLAEHANSLAEESGANPDQAAQAAGTSADGGEKE